MPRETAMTRFDAIVIGTGQAGPSLTARLAEEGLSTTEEGDGETRQEKSSRCLSRSGPSEAGPPSLT